MLTRRPQPIHRSPRTAHPGPRRGWYGLLVALLGLVLAGCDVTIGPVPTITPGGPVTTPQVVVELTLVPSPTAAPPSPTPGPAGAPITYKVKAGDNLSSIAQQFGVAVEDIVKFNNIADPNQIQEGQELLIPPKKPAGASTDTPIPTTTKVP